MYLEENISLTCNDCGQNFEFTQEEQQFYNEKGFSQPKRCGECRSKNRQRKKGGGKFNNKKRYDVVCSNCGVSTTVPFEPDESRAVYCPDCYQTQK